MVKSIKIYDQKILKSLISSVIEIPEFFQKYFIILKKCSLETDWCLLKHQFAELILMYFEIEIGPWNQVETLGKKLLWIKKKRMSKKTRLMHVSSPVSTINCFTRIARDNFSAHDLLKIISLFMSMSNSESRPYNKFEI